MPKKSTYHHGDLRRALIDAALELIAEKDVHSLSLREVARRVDVSHTAPYRHFADKEALLAVVAEEGFIEFTRYLQSAVDQAPQAPLKQLQLSGIAYVRYAMNHPTHYRVMFGKYCVDTPNYQSLVEVSNQSFGILVKIIRDGQSMGVMRAGEPEPMALGAWALVHGLAMLLLENRLNIHNAQSLESLVANTVKLMAEGIAIR